MNSNNYVNLGNGIDLKADILDLYREKFLVIFITLVFTI